METINMNVETLLEVANLTIEDSIFSTDIQLEIQDGYELILDNASMGASQTTVEEYMRISDLIDDKKRPIEENDYNKQELMRTTRLIKFFNGMEEIL